jgi:hypothetical protein
MIDLSALRPYAKNARRHSRAQIKQIAKSIAALASPTRSWSVTIWRFSPAMGAQRRPRRAFGAIRGTARLASESIEERG